VKYCLVKRNSCGESNSIVGLSDSLWMWESIPWDDQAMVCTYVETGGVSMRDCVTFSCKDVPESIAFISEDGHLGVMIVDAPKRFSLRDVIDDPVSEFLFLFLGFSIKSCLTSWNLDVTFSLRAFLREESLSAKYPLSLSLHVVEAINQNLSFL
jgi:hypothetical protein